MMRLSIAQATEFIESVLDTPLDLSDFGRVEAFILDKSVEEVSVEFDAFTAERGLEIDEDSVIFKADIIDICDDDCTMITILTAEGAMQ
jgi:hypothetical protein